MCDMTHLYVWHDAFICVTWRIDMCDMTHWYVWHDALICVTWRIDMCDMPHDVYERHDSCAWWCIHVSHWYLWRDVLICVTWRIHMCDTTHGVYERNDSCACDVILHTCFHRTHAWWNSCAWWYTQVSRWHVWRDALICVTLRVDIWHMADSCVWHDSQICVMRLMCIDDTFMCLVDMCDMTC